MTEEATPKEKKQKKSRVRMPEQAPKVRARNFIEVPTGYTPEMAKEEASRCLQCKNPGCVDGCPVGVEVFRGNTQDASTVPGKIEEVRVKYGIKDIVFVGDRGGAVGLRLLAARDEEGGEENRRDQAHEGSNSGRTM